MPNTLLQERLPDRLEDVLSHSLTGDEVVQLKLKGSRKEGLVCTDRRVMVVKGDFMTGQTFGTNIFQLPYANVASAEVKFHFLSAHFEVSAGGMQNTPKKWWSKQPGTDPAKAPNCVSISGARQARRFREACSFIITKCAEQRQSPRANSRAAEGPGSAKSEIFTALDQLSRLKREGVLSQQEFDEKKRELIARL